MGATYVAMMENLWTIFTP